MCSRRFAYVALLLVLGFTSIPASAGTILTATSIPPGGSILNVGEALTITLSIDPAEIVPSPATVPDAVTVKFLLTIGFDKEAVFSIVAPPTSLALLGPISAPDTFLMQDITATEAIDLTNPADPVIPAFDVTLYYQAVAPSTDPVTFFASIATQYYDSEGHAIESANDAYESVNLEYTVNASTAPVPEPSSLAAWSLLGGAFALCGLRRKRPAAGARLMQDGPVAV